MFRMIKQYSHHTESTQIIYPFYSIFHQYTFYFAIVLISSNHLKRIFSL